eukprot:TRINITY_DN14482_c0_g1_i1.p1 TRINITY_DN14482_c0_g1~~TRINITY_DN14482_c0_g1_i1.p1  ORF type:complete len:496 (+),score=74.92 TRINITY_DN14482_c0_g1_i1:77-1564(+)
MSRPSPRAGRLPLLVLQHELAKKLAIPLLSVVVMPLQHQLMAMVNHHIIDNAASQSLAENLTIHDQVRRQQNALLRLSTSNGVNAAPIPFAANNNINLFGGFTNFCNSQSSSGASVGDAFSVPQHTPITSAPAFLSNGRIQSSVPPVAMPSPSFNDSTLAMQSALFNHSTPSPFFAASQGDTTASEDRVVESDPLHLTPWQETFGDTLDAIADDDSFDVGAPRNGPDPSADCFESLQLPLTNKSAFQQSSQCLPGVSTGPQVQPNLAAFPVDAFSRHSFVSNAAPTEQSVPLISSTPPAAAFRAAHDRPLPATSNTLQPSDRLRILALLQNQTAASSSAKAPDPDQHSDPPWSYPSSTSAIVTGIISSSEPSCAPSTKGDEGPSTRASAPVAKGTSRAIERTSRAARRCRSDHHDNVRRRLGNMSPDRAARVRAQAKMAAQRRKQKQEEKKKKVAESLKQAATRQRELKLELQQLVEEKELLVFQIQAKIMSQAV